MRGKWRGLDAVFKVRKRLRYRLPVLDEIVRRQRTMREAGMLRSARLAKVAAPHLYNVGLSNSTLIMEYVPGSRLKDVASTTDPDAMALFEKLGTSVGRLHSAGVVHGDITTANVIVRDRETILLDFGLAAHSFKVEDHAVDVRLIKETLKGAHPSVADRALESLLRGYSAEVGGQRMKAILSQLRNIERRGRYAKVV